MFYFFEFLTGNCFKCGKYNKNRVQNLRQIKEMFAEAFNYFLKTKNSEKKI